MSEPIRVLQVMATLDRGGAEAVVMDWLRRIDKEQVTFDFAVNSDAGPYAFEAEAVRLGARIIRAPRFKLWNTISYSAWWYRCLKKHPEWLIVHAHHTVPAFAYLSVARLLGRVTIAHSHSASHPGRLGKWARWAMTLPLRWVAHYRLACSTPAATWMFGRRAETSLVHNGVALDEFEYDAQNRDRVRKELGLGDGLVVGHVGRMVPPKNHARLVQVFERSTEVEPFAHLLLVGDGELRSEIERHIRALKIDENVILVGVRADVSALLAAMDVLVLPSHFEGLPVSIVEAQASGLPCVVSDAVTREVGLTDLVQFISLEESDEVWSNAVLKAKELPRRSRVEELRAAGYDSSETTGEMQRLYVKLWAAPVVAERKSEGIHD